MFERPGECVREDVDKFMEFFEPPFGTLSLIVAIPYIVTMAHQIYSRLDWLFIRVLRYILIIINTNVIITDNPWKQQQ